MKQLLGYSLVVAFGVAMGACEPHSWEGETQQLFEEHGGHDGDEHHGDEDGDAHSDKDGDSHPDGHSDEKKGHETDGEGHDSKSGE